MKGHLIKAVCLGITLSSLSAFAAEVTDIATPVDDHKAGFQLGLRYNLSRDSGQISRERPCSPGDTNPAGQQLCAGGPQHVLNRELEYDRSDNWLDIDARIALPQRFELKVVVPIGVGDQSHYAFAEDVSPINSSIEPSANRITGDLTNADPFFDTYRYFRVSDGSQPPKRSGLGDLRLGLSWLAMSQEDHPEWANLLIGLEYVAPTGPMRAGDNNKYGDGIHWLQARIAASRQISFAEPFFQVLYSAPLAASSEAFPRDSANRIYDKPGHRLDFKVGTDFELYKEAETGRDFRVGVSALGGLRTAGQDRSALFEGFAGSQCNGVTLSETGTPTTGNGYEPDPRNDMARCGWLTQQLSAAKGDYNTAEFHHSGVTSVNAMFYFGAEARILAQFHKNVGLKLGLSWMAYSNHLITGASAGVDHDNDRSVSIDFDSNERNPDYNPTIDSPGQRFVFEGFRNLSFDAELYTRF